MNEKKQGIWLPPYSVRILNHVLQAAMNMMHEPDPLRAFRILDVFGVKDYQQLEESEALLEELGPLHEVRKEIDRKHPDDDKTSLARLINWCYSTGYDDGRRLEREDNECDRFDAYLDYLEYLGGPPAVAIEMANDDEDLPF